ncbi:sulfate adenylyltransferase [Candidatus Peregrinibacteria bacterium]|nr:sulfate adenylyltransferase [Candidatus Peregrinibacteria bacterium]
MEQGVDRLRDGSSAYRGLVPPHGGILVNRMVSDVPPSSHFETLPKLVLNQDQLMDLEQIAIGSFSPLEGFMCEDELRSVLDTMRLPNGVVWSLPIVLDASEADAQGMAARQDVALYDGSNQLVGLLHLEQKYRVDKKEMAKKLYGTDSDAHPGVVAVRKLQPIFLGGKISLLRRPHTETKEYELTPHETRHIFIERGWKKVVGFHTRNVIHRSHEFIQLQAMEQECCDGLFVHPVIGRKKAGDFQAKYIIRSYQIMIDRFYPKDSAVFAAFSTFSRYAGPREAIFTALCRKNFGCSHFVVGRDHTGVGTFYPPTASHEIFDRFPDIGIQPVRFNNVFYSKKRNAHIREEEGEDHREEEMLHISGTQARKMFEKGEAPPSWFMRPEISREIVDAMKNGERVFV